MYINYSEIIHNSDDEGLRKKTHSINLIIVALRSWIIIYEN